MESSKQELGETSLDVSECGEMPLVSNENEQVVKIPYHAENEIFLNLFMKTWKSMNIDINDSEIQEAIKYMKFMMSELRFLDIDFTDEINLSGYSIYYSPLAAAKAREKIEWVLKNSEELQSCVKKDINMISVGSGNGSDLFGLFSALSDECKNKTINLCLVDRFKGWERYFRAMQNLAQDQDNDFGNTTKFFNSNSVNTTYICHDVQREDNEQYIDALKNADIVWVKALFSIMAPLRAVDNVVEVLRKNMKTGALLLVLDSYNYYFYLEENFDVLQDSEVEHKKPDESYDFGSNPIEELCTVSNQQIMVLKQKPQNDAKTE